MRSKSALQVLFGFALAALLAACSSAGGSGPAGAQSVNLTGLDAFKYDPNTFTGKVGQPIHLVLTNKGVLPHSFIIDALNVKIENVQGGATGDTTFTPAQAGTFVFYCNQPGHKEAGMTGTLVVNP